MKFKKLLGLGLVGKVEGLVNRAGSPGSIYWPNKILCSVSWDALDGFHYSAQIIYDDKIMELLPSVFYTKRFKNFGNLINDLTEDVAQASHEFPNIRYLRKFLLPTKEHKRLYIYEPHSLSQRWLEESILDRRVQDDFFEILEEFVNGSWIIQKRGQTSTDRLSFQESRCLIEHAFAPFVCIAEIKDKCTDQHMHYTLKDSSDNTIYEDKIYIYNFDYWYHLFGAIKAERQDIESKGISLLPVNLGELWSEIQYECEDKEDLEENG